MKNERPVPLPTIGYIDEVGIHILHGLFMAISSSAGLIYTNRRNRMLPEKAE